MFNQKAINILDIIIKNDDYKAVNITNNQYQCLYDKCADIKHRASEDIEDEVEIILHECLLGIGYRWNEIIQWHMPKEQYTETEMEKYLIEQGYNVWDDIKSKDRCVDSSSVIQIADELGFEARLNNEDTYDFYKS